MEYLSSKKVMHGDLACRNILLAADNVVKICDFGLAKDIYKNDEYQKKTDGPLPVKWMAIESLRDRVFSTQSDVWSFGVVLWEMFSLGKTPYPGIEACDLFDKIITGYRMSRPDICPKVVYDIMIATWDSDPNKRPGFVELMDQLGDLLEEGERDHYLDLTQKFDATTVGATGTGTVNAVENKDYLGMMSPPDFNTQMSVSPHKESLENLQNENLCANNDYLKPTNGGDTGNIQVTIETKTDADQYLVPNSPLAVESIEMTPLIKQDSTKRHPNGNGVASLV